MQRVFVLDAQCRALMPCAPARARQLLKRGRAAVYRRVPFTVILRSRTGGGVQPVALKVDPGSRTSGLALVATFERGRDVVWAAELAHRGLAVRSALDSRRALRRGRRSRKTRYRSPRFDNRTRPAGWLPPSLRSRVDNVAAWSRRLVGLAPLAAVAVETVRFDTQALERPGITGAEYQQGTLAGYELREYLLEHWGRACAYCGAQGVPLEVEHIHPRSRGGSDRCSNLTLACVPCNQAKGNRDVVEHLAHDPPRLARLLAHARAPLRDAAAVNATRYACGAVLKALGLPTTFWSGGRTKYNRLGQDYPKAHWIDAACVGEDGAAVRLDPDHRPLLIAATGRGRRQVVRVDRYGFPRGRAGRVKRVHGFQTGDLVRLHQPRGKYAGVHVGRLAGIRADGRFDIATWCGKVTSVWRNFHLLQRGDGYAYT
ncbi:MAG: RNA-guided endonuclease IscB [Pseudomonadota bacterium]|nr:RNA-guided endonuclease IscB [Pseudomonadota bacterium]